MIHLAKFKRGPRVCKYNCWRVLKDDTNARVTYIHAVNSLDTHIVPGQRGTQYVSASFRLNGYFYISESSATPEELLERLIARITRRVYPMPYRADPREPERMPERVDPEPLLYQAENAYWVGRWNVPMVARNVVVNIMNNAVMRLGD